MRSLLAVAVFLPLAAAPSDRAEAGGNRRLSALRRLERRASKRPPIRDPAELFVAWRTVELVERNGDPSSPALRALPRPGVAANPASGADNPGFAGLAPDLANFLALGSSSLTPYEAGRLGVGFGSDDNLDIDPRDVVPFQPGDRLEVEVEQSAWDTFVTRGIVLPNGGLLGVTPDGSFRIFSRTGIKPRFRVLSLIATADLDGRPLRP